VDNLRIQEFLDDNESLRLPTPWSCDDKISLRLEVEFNCRTGLVLSSLGEVLSVGIRVPLPVKTGRGELVASSRIGVASVELVAGRDSGEDATRCSISYSAAFLLFEAGRVGEES
jgi:hypothetical protein